MRQMGGLSKSMPFVRNTFIIGALALAGLPILNGFWSKEWILEAGLEGGPLWAYLGMLLGAGLTALYTFRMVWLVFFDPPLFPHHAHDAPSAMRVSLSLLAFGSLTSWLLAGPFGHLLAGSLPYHSLHAPATLEMIEDILLAPASWLAIAVVLTGLAFWWQRRRLGWLAGMLRAPASWAQASFGFEWINRQVVNGTQLTAQALRITQTGQLNWNVFGILIGLITVLAILASGG
jgi:NADH-quinone oxidoreductase subunit L